MIHYTIENIKQKNMSKEAMKALISCCVKIATDKSGKPIAAEILMNKANNTYPHPNFEKDVLGEPYKADKVAYVATGLILLLNQLGYEETIHTIFEACQVLNSPNGGVKKKLSDNYRQPFKPWEPMK